MMLYENTRTVYDLVHNAAAEHGDRVFLQYEENGIIFRVTYKEFADECDAIAAWARKKRAQVGHKLKVGILGVSSHHYLAVLLGVMSGGDTGIPAGCPAQRTKAGRLLKPFRCGCAVLRLGFPFADRGSEG